MLLVLASIEDKSSIQIVNRLGPDKAILVSCSDLCQAGWSFSLKNPNDGRLVAGGEVIPVSSITGVLTRRPRVFEEEFMNVTKEDRSYVAAEVNSFLIAWLSSLNCPVVNRPFGNCLAGPDWHAEQWLHLAASIGVPIRNVYRKINLSSRRKRNTDRVCENTKTYTQQAIVIGRKWFGETDDYCGSIAVSLAQAAGTELLLVRFEDQNFVGASTFPPLDKEPVINAVLNYLEGES